MSWGPTPRLNKTFCACVKPIILSLYKTCGIRAVVPMPLLPLSGTRLHHHSPPLSAVHRVTACCDNFFPFRVVVQVLVPAIFMMRRRHCFILSLDFAQTGPARSCQRKRCIAHRPPTAWGFGKLKPVQRYGLSAKGGAVRSPLLPQREGRRVVQQRTGRGQQVSPVPFAVCG